MCDPISLLVATTVGTSLLSYRDQRKQAAEQKRLAAQQQREADEQKTAADLDLRAQRASTNATLSATDRAAAGSVATPRGVFGSRSFFART